jgi:hypothetical protein
LDYLLSVLEIQLREEAMGGSLIVDGHELCDPRTVRLNNGNTEPEGRKFLRNGLERRSQKKRGFTKA